MPVLRAVSFAILATFCCAAGFLSSSLALILDPRKGRPAQWFVRLWARAMLASAGARLVVVGAERFAPREPRVLVANHASYLDIPALFAAFPGQLRFVAKRSLLAMPFVGWSIALGGHFAIERDDPRKALDLLKKVARRMRRDRLSPVVFAEGTRSADGRLAPFRSGSMLLPLEVGTPVQPVAVLGSAAILPRGAFGPLRSGTIEVRVGDAVPVEGLRGSPGRKALSDRVRASLLSLGVPDSSQSVPGTIGLQ